MKFSSIPGLAETKKLLTDSVRNEHSAHAQLFVGADGALNLQLALAYAAYLHCENKTEDDICGVCPACVKSLKYIHPDTHFVFPLSNIKGDKDEERFKAEILKSWRAFLLEDPFGNLDDWTNYYGGEDKQAIISREESRNIIKKLALKPFESPNKVMIIWQPERMHPSAANGILKILEEPPPHTYFILVTNAADQLLPTITSRAQLITVPLLQDGEVENYLLETYELDPKRAKRITQLSEGDLGYALSLIENDDEDDTTEFFAQWMRSCYKKNLADLVARAETYHNFDKLSQKNMLLYSMNMMRETLLNLAGSESIHRVEDEELKFIQDFSKVMSLDKIEFSYKLMNNATMYLERNGSAKMIFLDLSMQLAKTLNP